MLFGFFILGLGKHPVLQGLLRHNRNTRKGFGKKAKHSEKSLAKGGLDGNRNICTRGDKETG